MMATDPTNNPPEEITRVFKEHKTSDGADILDEQPPITDAPVPQDETLASDPALSPGPVPVPKAKPAPKK